MESEVQQVLSVCPHADFNVIQKDLCLTRNVAETVNRLLDGIIKPTSEVKSNKSVGAASEQQQRTSYFKDYSANDSDDEDDDPLPNIFSRPGRTVMSSTVNNDQVQEGESGIGKVRKEVIVDLTLGEEDIEASESEHHHNAFVEQLHRGHTGDGGNGLSVTKDVQVSDVREISQHQKETSVPFIDASLPREVHHKDSTGLLPLDVNDNEVQDLTPNGSSLSTVKKLGHSVDISSSDDSEEEGVSVINKQSLISDAEEKYGKTYPQLLTTSNFGRDCHKKLKSNFVKADTISPSKIIQNSHCSWKQSSKGKMIDISSSDDSDDELPLWKRIQKKNQEDNKTSSLKCFDIDNGMIKDTNRGCGGTVKGLISVNSKFATSEGDSQLSIASSVSHHATSSTNGLSDDESQSVNSSESQLLDLSKGVKRKKRTPEEILSSKQQALERRAEREREKKERDQKREEKRKEKERELEQRKALREAHKALRPEECMKRLTATVDQSLLQESCGPLVLKKLQDLTCKVAISPQKVEGAITWSRQQTELNLGQDIQLSNLEKSTEETDALLVMKMNVFVHLINASTQDRLGNVADGETLNTHAHRCIQTLGGKSVTYLVQGAEQYFRNNKNRHQRNFRSAVLGAEADHTKSKKGKKRKDDDSLPVISRVQMEEGLNMWQEHLLIAGDPHIRFHCNRALVSLQLQHGCNVHCCETPDAIADFIGMFTKSVAEKPFKKERDKSTFSFHVNNEWAGGVRVSKDGVGMIKVWKQQLQQFRNVSPEIAAAIIAEYPSPQLLLQGYRNCGSTREAEMLLQDIVIRRGEGVLATTRRVGPELSRRVYKQMTSVDGDQLL